MDERSLEQSLIGSGGTGQQFELLTAVLRADNVDTKAYLAGLAAKLEGAIPGGVTVERGGGLFSKEKPIRKITVALGDETYTLTQENGRLLAQRAKAVRGIVLKNEQLGLDAWIDGLAHHLADEAQRSASARAALDRLLL